MVCFRLFVRISIARGDVDAYATAE